MSTDPIRLLMARRGIVGYQLPPSLAPQPEPVPVDTATLTAGARPASYQPDTPDQVFDRLLTDWRGGSYGA